MPPTTRLTMERAVGTHGDGALDTEWAVPARIPLEHPIRLARYGHEDLLHGAHVTLGSPAPTICTKSESVVQLGGVSTDRPQWVDGRKSRRGTTR